MFRTHFNYIQIGGENYCTGSILVNRGNMYKAYYVNIDGEFFMGYTEHVLNLTS